jgi:hypothetical protein
MAALSHVFDLQGGSEGSKPLRPLERLRAAAAPYLVARKSETKRQLVWEGNLFDSLRIVGFSVPWQGCRALAANSFHPPSFRYTPPSSSQNPAPFAVPLLQTRAVGPPVRVKRRS